MNTPPTRPIPVTLLTGFLGAGKTTVLRHVLNVGGAERICVVENEFGAANIDSEIVETLGPGLVRRLNGCICCAVKTDLVATFADLAAVCRAQGVERVVVETTGMAEPAELVPLFRAGGAVERSAAAGGPAGPLGAAFRLASVVTVVDTTHIATDLANSPIAQSQVAVADLLILTKSDLVSPAHLLAAMAAVQGVNPLADRLVAVNGVCTPSLFFSDAAPALRVLPPVTSHAHGDIAAHLLTDAGPHDLRRLREFFSRFTREHRDDLLRCKGFVHASRGRRVLLQGVRERFSYEPFGRFPPGDLAQTRLVLIGLSLDRAALQKGLEECATHDVRRPPRLGQDGT